MNGAIDIISMFESNAAELSLVLGDDIENKGTEVFKWTIACCVYYRDNSNDTLLNIIKFVKTLNEYKKKNENLFALEISFTDKDNVDKALYCDNMQEVKTSIKQYPIDKIIDMIKNDEIKKVAIAPVPEKIGYIKLSEYNYTYTEQKKFIEDLYIMKDDACEFNSENIINLNERRKFSGYDIVHGDSYILKNHEHEFDGKCYDFSDEAINYFWNNFSGDIFDELDPDNQLTVYHRKGKDWFVVPSVEEVEIALTYYEDTDDETYSYIDMMTIYEYTENSQLIEKMLEKLSELKQEVIEMSEYELN